MFARKHRWIVALAALLLGPVAQAQPMETDRSPRNWVLDLQFAGYFPQIDRGLAGTPFRDVFGDASLLTQIGFQRLLYQGIGTLGIGLQAGYTEFWGRAFIEGTGERSGDSTSLHVVPIQIFAAYRFDYAALHWGVPFAIYGRAGAGEWIWWTTDSGASGDDDSGAKFGVSWAAGLAFHLDWLDPKLARDFDRNYGVNNTYVYVEWARWNAKFRGNVFRHGFDAQGFDFSDEIISGGIAFEF